MPVYQTSFNLPHQKGFYSGKVRDVYFLDNQILMSVTSDRISSFDHILPRPIPYKGQVLNQIAASFLRACANDVPNWLMETPDPNVSVGIHCEAIPLEMVIRGYLVGHAWRTYSSGERVLCGVRLPEGMIENQAFETPIITPATKAVEGHDEDISVEEILNRQIVSPSDWAILEKYTRKLYEIGTKMAAERGLILVDTKYEFGKTPDGRIVLIDEVHTPDSSRYFYAEGYAEKLEKGEPQRQLSKEFVREWLISEGFMGKEGQVMPQMPDEFVVQITNRYIELYEQLLGKKFEPSPLNEIEKRIESNCKNWIEKHYK
jgi:phosphoribosylaminoimidazole-succinocarboxamide synthase